jgi:hypothetical protein
MGADAFTGFYGIEYAISPAEMEKFDDRNDERVTRARRNRLHFHIGRITDGMDYHLLIGKKIADLGVEAGEQIAYSDKQFAEIQLEVRDRLKQAGFSEEPTLIFKLEAQY